MRITSLVLFSGVALAAITAQALADGALAPGVVDVDRLAAAAAPVLPPGTKLMTMSKTPQPVVPGLPLTPREKAAFGDTATTIGILPADGAAPQGTISWSGYSSAGAVYSGSR